MIKLPINVEICHCEAHGAWCILVDDKRVVGGKCCGSWKVFKRWTVDAADLSMQLSTITHDAISKALSKLKRKPRQR